MRIGIDARMLDKNMTGIGRYTLNLVRHLLQNDAENQYLLLLGKNDLELDLGESDSFEVIRLNSSPLSLYTLFWMHRLLRKEKVELFHSPFFLAPLRACCPTVITVHDLMGLKYPGFFEGRNSLFKLLARFFVKIFVPLTLQKASRIIAVSETTKRELVSYLNIPEDRVQVVYEGVESCFRKNSEPQFIEKVRREFRINEKAILYVGNTRPYKNLPRLMMAFKIFQDKFKDYQLIIGTGDSRNLDSLKSLTRRLHLEKKIVFAGPLQDGEIVALMSSARVFVFPSLWEGFGLPPLEAMACGLPVVSSKAGSLPEILGDAAFLVNPENEEEIAQGIKQVITDKRLREGLIKKGLERVRVFSWKNTARETLQIYKSVEGSKNKTA